MSLNRATYAFFPFRNSWSFLSAENSPTLDLPAAVWQPSRAAIPIPKLSQISVTASANFYAPRRTCDNSAPCMSRLDWISAGGLPGKGLVGSRLVVQHLCDS